MDSCSLLLKKAYAEEFRSKCYRETAPQFWRYIHSDKTTYSSMNAFPVAVKWLWDCLERYHSLCCNNSMLKSSNAQSALWEELCGVLVTVVAGNVPEHMHQKMHDLMSAYCDVYWLMAEGDRAPQACKSLQLEDLSEAALASYWTTFVTALEQLQRLQLLDVLCSSAVVGTIHKKVAGFIQERALENFESFLLPSIEDQLMKIVMTWLRKMPGFLSTRSEGFWESQLKYYSYKTFAEVRISKLFAIIVDYPESKPALEELKIALDHVNCWSKLVTTLSQSIALRLLQPGASTVDIIAQYFATIKSFCVLDPSGHTVDKVCQPIRDYLSTREDTMRCFVSSLVEDSNGGELAEEMLALTYEPPEGKTSSEYMKWCPDPVGIMPGRTNKSKSLDVISVLVGIFGTPDFFMKEYCSLLSDRLLASLSYDISSEVCNLELLRKRFGESKLHSCDVMLKDVAESRRVNNGVSKHMTNSPYPVEAYVLSHCFWSTLRSEPLQLPPALQDAMDEYTRHYQSLKGLRTLEWKKTLGLVDIEVEIAEEVRTFSVSPPRAVLALLFQDKDQWTEEELCAETEMSESCLHKHISFWSSQGVVREIEEGVFVAADSYDQGVQPMVDFIEDGSEGNAQERAQEQQLERLWEYVEGMLTNLGALPLEKLHSMLLMFAGDDSTGDVSQAQLKTLMDSKTRGGKVVISAGNYSLPG